MVVDEFAMVAEPAHAIGIHLCGADIHSAFKWFALASRHRRMR
jgi:hypothetical protein